MDLANRHPDRSPDVGEMLRVLQRNQVRFVLVGSVAAAIYGVELQPGDLDVVPETNEANLESLITALREMEAQPKGPFGEWTQLESGEKKWLSRPTTDQELAEWSADVGNLETLDHLYLTRFGNFDVVPELAGTYESLEPRADLGDCEGYEVLVAHIDDLLARLTVPRREKDIPRVEQLRDIQRRGPSRGA